MRRPGGLTYGLVVTMDQVLLSTLRRHEMIWSRVWSCRSFSIGDLFSSNLKIRDYITLFHLLSTVDMLPIRGEYKLWLYRNYIVSLLRFHLSVDAITICAITKPENLATRYLKSGWGFLEVPLVPYYTIQVFVALAFHRCQERQN